MSDIKNKENEIRNLENDVSSMEANNIKLKDYSDKIDITSLEHNV